MVHIGLFVIKHPNDEFFIVSGNPEHDNKDLGIAAVEVDAADLGISRRRHADIARSDIYC